jgi:hypothetical protein
MLKAGRLHSRLGQRLEGRPLSTALRRFHLLLELLDHTFQIRIASAKAPCEPVPAAFRNPLAVSDHLELTNLARLKDGINIEALSDEGHETRDLCLVVLSRWAMNDLNLHLFPNPLWMATQFYPMVDETSDYTMLRRCFAPQPLRSKTLLRPGSSYPSDSVLCKFKSWLSQIITFDLHCSCWGFPNPANRDRM